MKETRSYYSLPENLIFRRNLKPEESTEFENPSGKLNIDYYEGKLPELITADKTMIYLLIANGHGEINRNNHVFKIQNSPAVFFLNQNEFLEVDGKISAWVVTLKPNQQTGFNLPTQNTKEFSEKILTPEDTKGEIDPSVANIYPQGKGEIIKWLLGQWNSQSLINVAFEGGGLGSIGDKMHKEPQITEIHLINQGRLVMKYINQKGQFEKIPGKKGDIVSIKPDTFCQMSRYSGDYKGFCLKWKTDNSKPIDPKAKIYFAKN